MNTKAHVVFQCSVWQDGLCVRELPPQRNLVLDSGLNAIGSAAAAWYPEGSTPGVTTRCALGTGTNVFKRDSGAITLQRAGDVVTASAAYFELNDVGRLIKWDSGEESYVVGYSSPTQVTTALSGAVPAGQATIYYVNRTGLQTEVKRTANLDTTPGANTYFWNGPQSVFEILWTFVHTTETSTQTYREIGWSWQNSGNLFGAELIDNGVGVTLVAGQQLRVAVRLRIRVSPTEPFAAPAITGVPGVTWTQRIVGVHWALVTMASEQCGTNSTLLTSLPPITGGVYDPGTAFRKAGTPDPYVAGTFTRVNRFVFGINEVNGLIHGFNVGQPFGGGFQNAAYLAMIPNASFTKTNTQTLTIVVRRSWGRDLVNT